MDLLFKGIAIPPADSSWWILTMTVWSASVVGSPHCLGMCGPLAAGVSRTLTHNIFYNLGRGVAYASIGALFGAAGEALMGFQSPELQMSATVLMIALVLVVSWKIASGKPWHMPWPNWFLNWHRKFTVRVLKSEEMGESGRSFTTGLLAAALPCGWLYTFAGLSAATGSASRGALVLVAFWLGTLPMMMAAPLLAGRALTALQVKSPRIAGLMVASSALVAIWAKWGSVITHTACH